MAPDRVAGYCKTCNQHVCSYHNEWIQISSVYSTYEYPFNYTQTGLVETGDVREGTKNTELEGLSTRSMACTRCGSDLGIKCVEVSEGRTEHKYVGNLFKYFISFSPLNCVFS